MFLFFFFNYTCFWFIFLFVGNPFGKRAQGEHETWNWWRHSSRLRTHHSALAKPRHVPRPELESWMLVRSSSPGVSSAALGRKYGRSRCVLIWQKCSRARDLRFRKFYAIRETLSDLRTFLLNYRFRKNKQQQNTATHDKVREKFFVALNFLL